VVLTLHDVTEQVRLDKELRYLSRHDTVTGLPNAVQLRRELGATLTRATRGESVAVLLVAVMGAQSLTDEDPELWDAVLRAVAARLAATAGDCLLARAGGSQFGLVHGPARAADPAQDIAKQVADVFREPLALAAGPVPVAVRIGVATRVGPTAATGTTLLEEAEKALAVAIADDAEPWHVAGIRPDAASERRRLMIQQMDEALRGSNGDGSGNGNGFELRHQPVVRLATGRVAAFEALTRWPGSGGADRPAVRPDVFIPIAEQTGRIQLLGRWALRQALRDARRWNDAGGPRARVNVNASVFQLRAPGFVDDVRAALADAGCPPADLVIEVTESGLLGADESTAHHRLEELRGLGVGLAVDDFGTGYSSLRYIGDLPVQTLKIDKSFTDRVADTLGMQTVAEGVETRVQRDTLREMGCTHGQGYLFAEPLSADEAVALMAGGGVLDP
jgi:predicted signal transduction protein with EAL and GGDEF domain